MTAPTSNSPTFLSLFSGCGGFDLGFENAGYRGLGAFDISPEAVSVFQNNVHQRCYVADLTTSSIKRTTFGKPDVVIAGSPCQGFSTLGNNRSADPRNSLLLRGAQLAVDLGSRVIVLENVCGVLSNKMRQHWETANSLFENAGYLTRTHRITCSEFGVPQIRRRVFLIAAKTKSFGSFSIVRRPVVGLKEKLSGVGGLPNHEPIELKRTSEAYLIASQIRPHQKLCNVRAGERSVPTWRIPDVFGKTVKRERNVLAVVRRLRRQLRVREFGDADPLTLSDIKQECGKDVEPIINRLIEKGYLRRVKRRYDLTHTFNGKYRRLSYAHPSPAVDTRFGTPKYFLHPEEHRGLTAREAARIQGFPDEFVFEGARATQFRLIGNAVPPPVSECIAMAILEYLL